MSHTKILDKRFWVWLTSVPSLVSASGVTNEEQLLLENKVNSIQGKVFINDGHLVEQQ